MRQRTTWILAIGAILTAAITTCWAAEGSPAGKKILFYSESDGFRHGMVRRPLSGELAPAEQIFKEFATKAGYEVSFSQSFHDLKNKGCFKDFDVVMFYTSGDPKFNKEALIEWVREGGAFVGIHSATDTWRGEGGEEYIRFIGGAFKTHGQGDKEVTVKVEDPNHPATSMIGKEWKLVDEIYHQVRFSRDNCHMLMSIDLTKTDLKPQKMEPDGDYPISWTRTEGKGRVFYTSLGHRKEVWESPMYQQHLLGGIAWALKLKEAGK